jgi:hypothetical protein
MGYLAEATETIRIGSGGIMLPNHAPFIVAEQIGTLESIYPGRIDLGLGRAPGTDPLTMRALRRHSTGADFDADVAELDVLLRAGAARPAVKAIPGAGLDVPIWILGSSTTARTSPRRSAALRVRLALRARRLLGLARDLPARVQALAAPRQALVHGGRARPSAPRPTSRPSSSRPACTSAPSASCAASAPRCSRRCAT